MGLEKRPGRDLHIRTPEALKTIPYRSKKELTGQVRIVTIPGADICACCGTHVSQHRRNWPDAGFSPASSSMTACGSRCSAADVRLRYLSATARSRTGSVSGLLSAKPLETAAAVQSAAGRGGRAEAARGRRWKTPCSRRRRRRWPGTGNVLLFEPAMSPDSVRRLTDLVHERPAVAVQLFLQAATTRWL